MRPRRPSARLPILLLALALALPLALPVGAQGQAGPWPQEAADAASSRQAAAEGPRDPGLRWHADLTAVRSPSAAEGYDAIRRPAILSPRGDVLVVVRRPDQPSVGPGSAAWTLVALDRATGEVAWEVPDVSSRCGPVVDGQGRTWVVRLDGDDPALEAVDVDGDVIPGTRLDDVLPCGSTESQVTTLGGDPEHLVLLAGRAGSEAIAAYDVSGPRAVEAWRLEEGDGFGSILYGPANQGLGVPHPVITDDAVLVLTETAEGDAVELVRIALADGAVTGVLPMALEVLDGDADQQVPADLRSWHPVLVADDLLVFALEVRARAGRDYQAAGILGAVDPTGPMRGFEWRRPMGIDDDHGIGAGRLTGGDGVVIARPDSARGGGEARLVGYDLRDGSQAWVGHPLRFGSAGFLSHVADAAGATYASTAVPDTTRAGPSRIGPTGELEWRIDPLALSQAIGLGEDRELGGNLQYGPIDDDVLYLVDSEVSGRVQVTAVDGSGGLAEATGDRRPGDPGVVRVDGGGTGQPIDTAIDICRFLVDDGQADAIALSRDDEFADALAGSALPVDCILFTPGGATAELAPETRAELRRALGPDGTVYVLGGVDAVGDPAAAAVRQDGYALQRLEGPTRFETAEAVAATVGSLLGAASPEQVVVAVGSDWADAVTVGAYAHATTTPVVLTPTDVLHPTAERVADAVTQATPGAEVLVIGGTAAIGEAVADALPGAVRRIEGPNRMATAVAIAEELWPSVPAAGDAFVLANLERGDAWTLALASAPLAARIGGPQLGLRVDSYPVETEGYLRGLGLTELPAVVLLGDLGFISDDVATAVEGSVPG